MTDHISDLLFACTSLNVENLAKEGIVQGVYNAGDVMYDLYVKMRAKLSPEAEMAKHSLVEGKFIIATIHRDFNTDNRDTLQSILVGLNICSKRFRFESSFALAPTYKE